MILLLTQGVGNPNAQLVRESCERQDAPYRVLDVDSYAFLTHWTWEFGANRVAIRDDADDEISPTAVYNGVFERVGRSAIDASSEQYRQFVCDELFGSLFGALCAIPNLRWMNSPQGIYLTSMKLYQLRVARDAGFIVPDTIVSTLGGHLTNFWRNHQETGVVTKAIYVGRLASQGVRHTVLFTNRVTSEHAKSIPVHNVPPVLLQAEIPKKRELRVVVIGPTVFSCTVGNADSTTIDWRTDCQATKHSEPVTLPNRVRDACIGIVSKLGLTLGIIDLIEGRDGQYYFLEVNQQGVWKWMELDLGLPISQTIVQYLTQ